MSINEECINHNAVRGNSRKGGSMKYIIEFDDAPSMREEGLNYYKCIDAPWFSASDHIINKLTPYDPDEEYQRGFDDAHKISVEECRNKYEQGLIDAWDLADDVSHNRGNILDILGCPTFGVAFEQLTASEAIQTLKEYERKKAEKEIRVGDEVTCCDRKGVVTRIDHDHDKCNVCWSTGETGWYPISDLTKTGRSFPEIVEVLKKMRGEET